jgi:hypothetical protein
MKRNLFILLLFSIIISCNNKQEEDINLKHLNHIAKSINSDLIQLKKEILTLSLQISHTIPFDKPIQKLPEKYYFKDGKALQCQYQNFTSSVYLPSNKELTEDLKKIIINSELIDTLFKNSITSNPLLSQVYFLDTNSFLRIYPFVDVLSYIKESTDLREFITYQTAEEKTFIDEEVYWASRPFADPFGRGWVFSCVEPIYYRDQFMGILSGDITLRSLKEKYFSSDTELVLLTDASGKLICCTKESAKLFNIPVLRDFHYYKPITEDIFTFNNPSLIHHKNSDLRKVVKSLLAGKNKEDFYVENKKYTIYKSYIEETNWVLFKITN